MRKLLLKLKIKMYVILTLVYIIVGIASFAIFYFLAPQYYFKLYPIIGIFYWITGMIFNYLLDKCRTTQPDQLLNTYMFGRMIKFLATILFLLIYVFISKTDKLVFGISLMANYIIYTALDLYVYYSYNKRVTRNGSPVKK